MVPGAAVGKLGCMAAGNGTGCFGLSKRMGMGEMKTDGDELGGEKGSHGDGCWESCCSWEGEGGRGSENEKKERSDNSEKSLKNGRPDDGKNEIGNDRSHESEFEKSEKNDKSEKEKNEKEGQHEAAVPMEEDSTPQPAAKGATNGSGGNEQAYKGDGVEAMQVEVGDDGGGGGGGDGGGDGGGCGGMEEVASTPELGREVKGGTQTSSSSSDNSGFKLDGMLSQQGKEPSQFQQQQQQQQQQQSHAAPFLKSPQPSSRSPLSPPSPLQRSSPLHRSSQLNPFSPQHHTSHPSPLHRTSPLAPPSPLHRRSPFTHLDQSSPPTTLLNHELAHFFSLPELDATMLHSNSSPCVLPLDLSPSLSMPNQPAPNLDHMPSLSLPPPATGLGAGGEAGHGALRLEGGRGSKGGEDERMGEERVRVVGEEMLNAHVACLEVATPLDQLPLIQVQMERADLVASTYTRLLHTSAPPTTTTAAAAARGSVGANTNSTANGQFVKLLQAFKEQLEEHIRVHAREAVTTCARLKHPVAAAGGTAADDSFPPSLPPPIPCKPIQAQFVKLLRAFKEQLEEHIRVHAREAVTTCARLKHAVAAAGGTAADKLAASGATMSDDGGGGRGTPAKEEGCTSQGNGSAVEEALLKEYGREGFRARLLGVREEIMRKRRAGKLPGNTTQVLKAWWNEHIQWPYPTEEEKAGLMAQTGLELKQVNNWFINQRKRNWHGNPAVAAAQHKGPKQAKRK
ncbi:unnamed protein product [Closterium sp. Yama58-4]|nr:unnamed protein product [Closterium sp. Yama58-4]